MQFDSAFTASLLEKIGGNSATIILDQGGVCQFASSQTESVLGVPPPELLGGNFLSRIRFYSMEGRIIAPEQTPIGKHLANLDFAQTTPFFCRLSAEGDGQVLALTTLVVAGEQGRFIVAQIRRAKREVEVGEMKSLFISFAAHQLKTPSSVVKGFLELMMRQGESAFKEEQWHYLTSAFESNEQLIEVSKTLLNMARLEGGLIEPKIAEFDPNRALQSKIASFAPLYKTKRLTVNLSTSQDETVTGLRSDESFFLEVFGILLGNAIKHSLTGTAITVSCVLSEKQCEVHAIDNGPGIPNSIRATLFEAAQNSFEQENTHGLGLYMAKKYTALLGGSIGLADSETGSDFYFILPNAN
jgi:signal transduction histidine kinase